MLDPLFVSFVTFLLALLAYACLAWAVLSANVGLIPPSLHRTTALLAVVHVLLVWAFRYQWQFDQATRNGYFGFVIFHAALLLIVTATWVGSPRNVALLRVAFVVVTAGALGAVVRYDEVAFYRIPVAVTALWGGYGIVMGLKRRT